MTSWADFDRAVQAILASQRVGRPVFARLTIQGLRATEELLPRLAFLVGQVRDWFRQTLSTVYATGSVERGQLSLTLQFADGATAQLSLGLGQLRGDGVDLMLLGNHGAIYHDAGTAQLWDEPLTMDYAVTEPALQELIERALQTGRPQSSDRR
ncbi:MAG: hypothetical protein NZ700_14285 [Gemmataceae bacterium]|nr:hypothetical protein [Gemmataceae bacterium]MDW8264330.1 hypothetical protein [Gemmataceae bacterium]